LSIELPDEAKELLVEKGYDPAMGARPLRRAIQRYIEDPLAEELIRGQLKGGDIQVYLDAGALAYRPVGSTETGHRLS
jgi:ATP-dependent Clp protease ATP-binding subunit ClpC